MIINFISHKQLQLWSNGAGVLMTLNTVNLGGMFFKGGKQTKLNPEVANITKPGNVPEKLSRG